MTDKTINISESNLEKGLYDETGAEISNNKYIRTKNKLSGDASFLRYLYNFKAVRNLPLEGSFDGTTGYNYNAVACDRLTGYTADANYKIEYWWFKGYGSNGRILYVGSMMLRTPVVGGNKQNEAAYFSSRACWQTSAYADRYVSTYVVDVDENADSITYYINGQTGETVTTSLKEYITNSTWQAQTENFIFDKRGKRDSELVFCNVGVLGYRNSVLVYNDRWNSSDMYRTDFLKYAPIDKFHMVFEIPEVENPAVDELIQPHIILVAESWYLDDDDKLNNIDLPESTGDDIYTPPYPATMWYLDSNRKLSNMLLPEPYSDSHSIVHDNPDGTEYLNQHSNAYDSALSSLNNNYRIRLEILTDEETVIGEITKDLSLTATGQITINYEQITRRSCSLSLINVDNKYIPTKNSPFWLNRKFKLWLGLVVGKDTYWWSQGIFYTVSANATGRILSIEGVDKGGALDGTLKLNMTEAQYQFKRGKALTEMIKQTLALDVGNPYGANNSPIGFGGNRPIDSQPPLIGIEYYGFNTVADISIDANSYISEMFVNMAELYAADCYYNTNGNLVFEQHIDSSGYNYVPTQWSFTDLSSTFDDVNYEYSYEGENVVTVYTNTTEAGVRNVAWTAYNTNPLSPLNVATGIRRAPHIEIPYYHNEQLSQDQQEAQQIKDCRSTANHYLLANSMLGMTLNFNAPIIPHMDVNKTIQISDRYADIEDGIYVVQSITMPLSSDKMQISATNINWLPNDMTFGGVSEIVQSNNNQNGGAET